MAQYEIRSDQLAVNEPNSKVRLTHFRSLSQGSSHFITMDEARQNFAPPSSERGNQIASQRAEESESFESERNRLETGQFQIVWHSLAFDVTPSLYERMTNCVSGTLHKRPKQRNKLQQGSEYALHKSSEQLKSSENLEQANGRNIFENLNGYIRSGEISAIIGPSGVGKTSLLKAICGGHLDGFKGRLELRYDEGFDPKKRIQMSIIPQKDYLIENLTVRENLLYSSKLLNSEQNFDHEANILRVVKMFNLSHCLDSPTANTSGGEYKRVSIAQELLRQPDIIVLDEPTSGLDSLNCKKLIRTLKHLIDASRRGEIKPIAIVMTIHQPDVDIFSMFDHVYCMAPGGRVIFDGRPQDAISTLRSHAGFVLEGDEAPAEFATGAHVNPANLLIEIASEEVYGQEPIASLARVQRKQFEQKFSSSATTRDSLSSQCFQHTPLLSFVPGDAKSTRQETNQGEQSSSSRARNSPSKSLKRDKRLSSHHSHSGKFWYHTSLLTRRAFVSALRDPQMTMVSLVFHLTVPFVMWTVYPQRIGSTNACPVVQREMDLVSMMSDTTIRRLENMPEEIITAIECSTMLFITAYALSVCCMSLAAMAFPLNMHILLKEVRNGWYDLKAFVLAKQVACIPFEVIFPAVSMVLVYNLLSMPASDYNWRLWSIALVVATVSMMSNTQGLILGSLLMDSVESAVFLSIASSLPLVMMSGFTVRLKGLPMLFQHLSWISPYRYMSDLLIAIRFGFGICPCAEDTNEYLISTKPYLRDLSASLKPTFLYLLASAAGDVDQNEIDVELANKSANVIAASPTWQAQQRDFSGLSRDLILNATERGLMMARMESDEVDIFGRMADMMARSMSYGQKIESCASVMSEQLRVLGTNVEDSVWTLIFAMLLLLLAYKTILFFVVKLMVGQQT